MALVPATPNCLPSRRLACSPRPRSSLHDDLVPPAILALANPRALTVNVGKRCGAKKITQAEINQLMIEKASQGISVVRLKSGDPLVFGRAARRDGCATRGWHSIRDSSGNYRGLCGGCFAPVLADRPAAPHRASFSARAIMPAEAHPESIPSRLALSTCRAGISRRLRRSGAQPACPPICPALPSHTLRSRISRSR